MKNNLFLSILLLVLANGIIFGQNDHLKSSLDSLKKEIINNADAKNSLGSFLTNASEIKKQIWTGTTINVKASGAVGNGIEDDTKIIQSIFDSLLTSVSNNGIGGTIYFPPGIYKISEPLKIPPRVIIKGSGAFTQEHARDRSWSKNKDYNKFLPSVIRLANNSNCNIIEPFVDSNNFPRFKPFESVIIEQIVLDGNRYEQSGNVNETAGIYMPELQYAVRSGMVVQNVLIIDVNGTGFYNGHKQNEFLLMNVFTRNNAKNGFYIGGEDISMYRVASGENDLYGFHFKDRGAYKCIDLDSWGNKKGVVIEDAVNGNFIRLQCDINSEEGLILKGAEDMTFVASVFATNSKRSDKMVYSEIKLENTNVNGYGPFGIKFIGCTIGSGNIKNQAKHGIEDLSEIPRENIIVGTTFKAHEFIYDVVNDNVYKYYMINSSTTGNFGAESFDIDFFAVKENYFELTPRHNTIFIDGVTDCKLVLPSRSRTKLGKDYKIRKSSTNIELSFISKDDTIIETIKSSNDFNNKSFLTATVIFLGDHWVLYKDN
ncbi:MAG: hypothetical protein HND52_06970 [Ignavibacteriae bacterium]|nr:hypothetical protein [Ignavibacteriota bacterium]NOG97685.1 hypothetical protein [Ignavibacteriota bacterium]